MATLISTAVNGTLTTTGSVGIGTTSPATPLHVTGGASGTGGWNRTATLAATYPGLIFNSNGTKWGGMAYDYSAAMRFWVNANNDDIFAGTLALSILNNGNVGIGTTAPGAKLHVVGNVGGGVGYNGGFYADDGTGSAIDANWGFDFSKGAGDDYSTRVKFYPGATSARKLGFYDARNNAWLGYFDGNANSNLNFIFNSGGNVGIGTTAPTDRLHVRYSDTQGYIRIGGSNGAGNSRVFIAAEGDSSYMDSYGNNTHKSFSINANPLIFGIGNVLINTTTNSSYRLDVNGTIRASGDIIAYSDARVKENINTIEGALNKVLHLRGVSYNKIGETDKKIGVIAQEVLGILPEVVSEDLQGMYSVAYGNIVGVLIEAIKELTVKVEQLEAKLK
jgi:hypothetical protein